MLAHDHSRSARAESRLARGRAARDTHRVRTSLDHLPSGKRRELAYVGEVLTDALAQAVADKPSLAGARLLKIVLFGSYARGDWVEDPIGRYFSDYDLLLVVDDERLTDVLEVWEGAERRLLGALAAGRELRTPVNFIVHTLDDVNAQLARGRYFFVDIVRDGIALLEVPGSTFVEPQELSPATALAEANQYYQDNLKNADESAAGVPFYVDRGNLPFAAFLLHQAAESMYNGLLLALTLYTPKSHNLVRLRQLAEPLDARLAEVWPTDTKFQKRCFELLRSAYVKARYSRHYQITPEELDWLGQRIVYLRALVVEICQARIDSCGRMRMSPGAGRRRRRALPSPWRSGVCAADMSVARGGARWRDN